MNPKNHRLILSFVSITIIATIMVQVYWNYFNYQSNKIELINQVQVGLDNAIESYYTDIAKGRTVQFNSASDTSTSIIKLKSLFVSHDTLQIDTTNSHRIFSYSTNSKNSTGDTSNLFHSSSWSTATSLNLDNDDTIIFNNIDTSAVHLLASKIYFSMRNDSLDLNELSNLIHSDFESKGWPFDFGLLLRDNDCDKCEILQTHGVNKKEDQLMVTSQSALIPGNTTLEIYFSNIAGIILKRGLFGILLSFLLSASIIFCLLFLFKTINEQKQLAEIKNDLISNITHEFKTPITTIGTALEGIENFSGINDINKTKKYLGISNEQLTKLNTMVEKLLETASIDREHLILHLEKVDISKVIQQQIEKYQLAETTKSFSFKTDVQDAFHHVDVLHFESAINNLIENAVKYGGDEIEVQLNKTKDNALTIQVRDSGKGIPKDQRAKIFDKFYRIPTGNIHNVKGFGIGLYYAQKIIEKHGGTLELIPSKSVTNFQITLPYAD